MLRRIAGGASFAALLFCSHALAQSGAGAISVGGIYYTCGVSSAGAAKCWGYNSDGELGDGTTTDHYVPRTVTGLASGVARIKTGGGHTCAIGTDTSLRCWGESIYGQLGDGTSGVQHILTPVAVSGLGSGVTEVTAGTNYTCAIVGGAAKCWGADYIDQLGDGSLTDSAVPIDVPGLSSGVIDIAAGSYHTCAVLSGGSVKCWGYNANGQVDGSGTSPVPTPVNISIGTPVAKIGAGGSFTCVLTTAGGVKCWGDNSLGQLGDGTNTSRSTPADVSGLASGVAALSVGGGHACVLTTAGGMKCWGDNSYGEIGDGTTTNRSSPVNVSGLTSGVTAISAGNLATCAIASGGVLKCWGANFYGELGDGTTQNRSAPVTSVSMDATPPGAPTVSSASAGNAQVTVAFAPPSSDGGSPVTGYTVTSNPSGISATGTGSPITVTKLVNGTAYTFTVTATNLLGTSAASTPSSVATPSTVPDAPQIGAIVAGNGQLTVGFTPSFDGGAPVTTFTASCTPTAGGTAHTNSAAASPIAVSGLTNGTSYACTVRANNFRGSSPLSAAATGIPDAAGDSGVQLSSSFVVFAATMPGTTGAAQSLTITNNSGSSRTITALSATTSFTISGCAPLPATLAPGQSCTAQLALAPIGVGRRRGTASVTVQGFANAPSAALFGSGSPIRAGLDFNLAIASSGQVWGWGNNSAGKLGNDSGLNSAIPVNAVGLDNVIAVSAGLSHSLAVKSDGTVWAWGLNDSGQLGYATPTPCWILGVALPGKPCSRVPQQVPGLTDVIAVEAGWAHSIALKRDGTVWTWGSNASGQLARDDSLAPYTSPGRANFAGIDGPIVDIVAGSFHNLARSSFGTWYVWGSNANGQLGTGSTTDSPTPVSIGLSDVTNISAGTSHNIALKGDGTVMAWGWNRYGQVGDATTAFPPPNRLSPVLLSGPSSIVEVSAGYSFSMARQSDGTLWAWGFNKSGQLGVPIVTIDGTNNLSVENCGTGTQARPCKRSPVQVTAQAGAVAAFTGGAHAVIRRPDGSLAMFGDNGGGQLGNTSGNFGATGGLSIFDPDSATSHQCPPTQQCFGTVGSGGSVGLASSSGSFSFESLDNFAFGTQLVGTTSGALSLELVNQGGGSINVSSVTVDGDFSVGTNCTSGSLPQGTSCEIDVYFSPSAPGSRSGTLTVNTDYPGAPTVTLPVAGQAVGAPGAPYNVSATAGNGQATVSFNVPPSDGGSPITGYTVTSNPGGIAASGASSPITVSGLANGTPYVFFVTATNTYGTGASSSPSNSVTPATLPGAPTIGTATAGNTQASIAYTPPASNGGAAITGYTATCNPGAFANTGASPIVISGLTNGTQYTCFVTATNSVGTGPASGNVNVTPHAPVVAGRIPDFNGDGKPDILWSNTANGATYAWYMNGPPPVLVSDAFIAQIDPSWKVQGVADFNGDGKSDLVWRNTGTGATWVWYMNGTAFMSDALIFTLPPQWVIQGIADFNGDGHPDFLLRNTDPASGVGFVWFFNDVTDAGSQFLFGIDPIWKVEQVGDMNGDGQPDLLFRNMSSGLAFAWYTQFSGGSLSLAGSSTPIFSIDPVWEIVQLEDWNGDGQRDLLFRNASTGVVFVWYMNGTTLGASDFVIQIDPSWEIVPRR